jgi:hypothetical protein
VRRQRVDVPSPSLSVIATPSFSSVASFVVEIGVFDSPSRSRYFTDTQIIVGRRIH